MLLVHIEFTWLLFWSCDVVNLEILLSSLSTLYFLPAKHKNFKVARKDGTLGCVCVCVCASAYRWIDMMHQGEFQCCSSIIGNNTWREIKTKNTFYKEIMMSAMFCWNVKKNKHSQDVCCHLIIGVDSDIIEKLAHFIFQGCQEIFVSSAIRP